MNLIEKKVRGEFATWAQENENKDIFPKISQEESSYYIDRSGDETYLMEYSVPNIAQLKADLERYSGLSEDTELSKKLAIAICQYRFCGEERKQHGDESVFPKPMAVDADKTLPEYIYVC